MGDAILKEAGKYIEPLGDASRIQLPNSIIMSHPSTIIQRLCLFGAGNCTRPRSDGMGMQIDTCNTFVITIVNKRNGITSLAPDDIVAGLNVRFFGCRLL